MNKSDDEAAFHGAWKMDKNEKEKFCQENSRF